jgi:hypothetical protein
MTRRRSPISSGLPDDADEITTAIEALAHGRYDLVEPELRRAIEADPELALELEQTRELSVDLGNAFVATAVPSMDLDALIANAMDKRADPSPSRRAVFIAGVVGAVLAGVLAVIALPAPSAMLDTVRHFVAVSGAVDSLVTLGIPGGWTLVAFVGLVFVFFAVFAMRRMTRAAAASAMVLLLPFALATPSYALDFEGEWPEAESSIDLEVENGTVREVLDRATEAAGVGLVHSLPDELLEERVTLRVEDASLRDVLDAVLGDAPVTARRTASILVLRPLAEEPAESIPSEPTPPEPTPFEPTPFERSAPEILVPPVPPNPPPPPLAPGGHAGDRVNFGGDIHIRPGERVNSVATAGGDVVVEGEVLRDVVSAGGDVDVRPTGVVHGGVFSWGGDVEVDEGAVVEGEIATAGGEVRYAGASRADRPDGPGVRIARGSREPEEIVSSISEWLDYVSKSAAWHAVLFLVGLFLMSVATDRYSALRRTFRQTPIKAAFVGMLSGFVTVVLVVVLTVLVIGIPAAIALGIGAALALMAGTVALASVIGEALPIESLRARPIATLATGLLVLFFASIIPGVGPLLSLLVGVLGIGAVVLTRFGKKAPKDA